VRPFLCTHRFSATRKFRHLLHVYSWQFELVLVLYQWSEQLFALRAPLFYAVLLLVGQIVPESRCNNVRIHPSLVAYTNNADIDLLPYNDSKVDYTSSDNNQLLRYWGQNHWYNRQPHRFCLYSYRERPNNNHEEVDPRNSRHAASLGPHPPR
jgi:hypothetical protein